MQTLQISFTDKEISVIQLMVPEMTPEETCNKVLHDWFRSNLGRLSSMKDPAAAVDDIIANNSVEIAQKEQAVVL